jgi:hypothetical protein
MEQPSSSKTTSVLDTRFVVQEWLSLHTDVEFTDWPPQAPNMKFMHNVWGEVKRKMQETWPVIPPRTVMNFGPFCLTLGRKMLRYQCYVPSPSSTGSYF